MVHMKVEKVTLRNDSRTKSLFAENNTKTVRRQESISEPFAHVTKGWTAKKLPLADPQAMLKRAQSKLSRKFCPIKSSQRRSRMHATQVSPMCGME